MEDYIKMATIIRNTKLHNYKMARYPVSSNLNLEAWRRHLQDYHDKRLLQYLTFGFPLSILDDSNLHRTDITNHHSAIQFPGAVGKYLDKEMHMGAILGPFHKVKYEHFHCSPLLTRPKDNDERRVILDLSYPAGASVNDAVSRDKFDNTSFTLKFPTIDDIVDNIRHNKGEVLLAKIDIASATVA